MSFNLNHVCTVKAGKGRYCPALQKTFVCRMLNFLFYPGCTSMAKPKIIKNPRLANFLKNVALPMRTIGTWDYWILNNRVPQHYVMISKFCHVAVLATWLVNVAVVDGCQVFRPVHHSITTNARERGRPGEAGKWWKKTDDCFVCNWPFRKKQNASRKIVGLTLPDALWLWFLRCSFYFRNVLFRRLLCCFVPTKITRILNLSEMMPPERGATGRALAGDWASIFSSSSRFSFVTWWSFEMFWRSDDTFL